MRKSPIILSEVFLGSYLIYRCSTYIYRYSIMKQNTCPPRICPLYISNKAETRGKEVSLKLMHWKRKSGWNIHFPHVMHCWWLAAILCIVYGIEPSMRTATSSNCLDLFRLPSDCFIWEVCEFWGKNSVKWLPDIWTSLVHNVHFVLSPTSHIGHVSKQTVFQVPGWLATANNACSTFTDFLGLHVS